MSDGTEMSSAKTGMLKRILERSGTPADLVVMIGDTRYDAEAARDTGIPFIGVLFGYGTRAEMEAAGARHFVNNLEELRADLWA